MLLGVATCACTMLHLSHHTTRLREALRYMVYGKDNAFNAERIIDLLDAFEDFKVCCCTLSHIAAQPPPATTTPIPPQVSSVSARGSMDDGDNGLARSVAPLVGPLAPTRSGGVADTPSTSGRPWLPTPPLPFPVPAGAALLPGATAATVLFSEEGPLAELLRGAGVQGATGGDGQAREALKFLFSPDGQFFREFLMDEIVKSIDALSREQLAALVAALGLSAVRVPLFTGAMVPLAPRMTAEDRQVVQNMTTILQWLLGDPARMMARPDPALVADLLPYVPDLATSVIPDIAARLSSRIVARSLRAGFDV